MKNKVLFLSFTLLGLTFLLSGCGLSGTQNLSNTQNTPVSPSVLSSNIAVAPIVQTDAGQVINTVLIQGFAFNPGVLKIKKGETVSWINKDTAPHQIKSSTFGSDTLSNGQSFSYVFNETGTFNYSCSIHPSMTGQIIIE